MIELQQINRIKLADKNLLFSRLNKQKTLIKDDFERRGKCEGHDESVRSGGRSGGNSSGRSDSWTTEWSKWLSKDDWRKGRLSVKLNGHREWLISVRGYLKWPEDDQ